VRLCEALAARGHDVTLLCRSENAREVRAVPGVRTVPLERRRGLLGGRRGYVRQVRRALTGGVDVVHVHGLARMAWWLRDARSRRGAPLVLTAHSADELGPSGSPAGTGGARRARRHVAQVREILARADLVTGPSRWFAARLRDAGAARVAVVGWGPSEDGLATVPARPFLEDGVFRILVLARLVEAKGVPVLLEGFARAFAGDPTGRLVVAGDGPQRGAIEARARALGLADRVELTGFVEGDRLRRVLEGADVVAVPTLGDYETFSCAALDGSAAGRALVVADGGALPERVEAGEGILAHAGDAEAWARALRALREDGARTAALGAAGRATAGGQTWDRVAQNLETLYAGSARGSRA